MDPLTAPARPHPNCYWVIPGRLLAGEYPGAWRAAEARHKLAGLLDAGVTFFLDLTEPYELEPYADLLQRLAAARGVTAQHTRLSIPDMDVPAPAHMAVILDTLEAALAAGQTSYVHCWGGIGRTGTVVGCYLVRHGLTGAAALAQIAAWWPAMAKSTLYPRSPQTDAQVDYVRGWREPR